MKTNKVKTALNSILFASLLTGGMTFLTGCLVGPTESPAVQVADPSAEVAAQISESVSNSALAMTEGLLGSMTFNQFSSVLNGTLFSGNQTFTATVVSDSDEANFRENARTVLLALLQRRADLDTSDTQALAPSNDFCNLVASGNAFYACMEFTSHLLFRVRFTDEHSGELKGYYDQAELVSILFAPHQMTGKIDTAIAQNFLAGLKTVFSAYSIDTGLPTFSSASGLLQATVSRVNNSIQISYQALQAIRIISDWSGTPVEISVAAGSSVGLEYLRDSQLANLNINLGTLDLLINSDAELKISDTLSGRVTFNNQAGLLQLEKLAITGDGFIFSANDQSGFSVVLAPLTLDLSFLSDGIQIAIASSLGISVALTDGTTNWSADAGATLTIEDNNPVHLENADLSMINTGSFGTDLNLPAGQCFSGPAWVQASCL